MCTSAPKYTPPPPVPAAEEAPAPVQTDSKEVSEQAKRAKAEQRTTAQKRGGRSSTILTGSLGLQEQARTGKTVLGA